jgi:hypothetical protein
MRLRGLPQISGLFWLILGSSGCFLPEMSTGASLSRAFVARHWRFEQIRYLGTLGNGKIAAFYSAGSHTIDIPSVKLARTSAHTMVSILHATKCDNQAIKLTFHENICMP